MMGFPVSVRVLLFRGHADMRKGLDGLRALVVESKEDPYSGDLYVFLARRHDHVKILWWDRGGFVVWHKRLERGCFRPPRAEEDTLVLDAPSLVMLLDGIDVQKVRRAKHWSPTNEIKK
jgi:transposase